MDLSEPQIRHLVKQEVRAEFDIFYERAGLKKPMGRDVDFEALQLAIDFAKFWAGVRNKAVMAIVFAIITAVGSLLISAVMTFIKTKLGGGSP